MPTTSQLRSWWSPACTGPFITLNLHGAGRITVRAACADAFRALNDVLVKWNYQTRRADTGAYVCRKITGGSGYSLHAYGIAADLNWQSNPYTKGPLITDMPIGMVQEIEALRTGNGQKVFRWGGRYTSVKDAMHYEIFCRPQDIATGIRGGTPVTPTAPEPIQPSGEDDDMKVTLIRSDPAQGGDGSVYAVWGFFRWAVTSADYPTWLFLTGGDDEQRQIDPTAMGFFVRNTVDAKNVDFAALYSRVAANGVADLSDQIAGIEGSGAVIDAQGLIDGVVDAALDEMSRRLED